MNHTGVRSTGSRRQASRNRSRKGTALTPPRIRKRPVTRVPDARVGEHHYAGGVSLEVFSPVVAEWFRASFDAPTEAQDRGWPAIAAGDHTLILAPTGSGKTLAAF